VRGLRPPQRAAGFRHKFELYAPADKEYNSSNMGFSFTKLVPALVRQGVKTQSAVLSETDRRLSEVCSFSTEKALPELGTSKEGLDDAGVRAARERFGFNALTKKEKKFFVFEILGRFKNPLAIQLLIIGGISLWMGDMRSAVVVGGMVVYMEGQTARRLLNVEGVDWYVVNAKPGMTGSVGGALNAFCQFFARLPSSCKRAAISSIRA